MPDPAQMIRQVLAEVQRGRPRKAMPAEAFPEGPRGRPRKAN
jgi:hypothetical protein